MQAVVFTLSEDEDYFLTKKKYVIPHRSLSICFTGVHYIKQVLKRHECHPPRSVTNDILFDFKYPMPDLSGNFNAATKVSLLCILLLLLFTLNFSELFPGFGL